VLSGRSTLSGVDAIASYVVDALRGYAPERVIVFGSHATGDAHRGSDVDLLVVKDDPRRAIERMRDVYARLQPLERAGEWRSLPPFDVLVVTPAELDEHLATSDPFFEEIMAEGRTIFDAADHAP
jgi:predicted nucleotidyltransferase